VAVARGRAVGIDVEQHRLLDDLDEMMRMALTAAEMRDLAALPATDRNTVFLRWWTAKEAALKAQGIGLATAPDQVALRYDHTRMPDAAVVPNGAATQEYRVAVFDPFAVSRAVVAIATAGDAKLKLIFTSAQRVVHWARA
jgi:4'-phosphopantetheinyl transferase